MAKSQDEGVEQAKRIMSVLVLMPPKHHDEMKLGKPSERRVGKGAKRRAHGDLPRLATA
jgi:hypothetical protein